MSVDIETQSKSLPPASLESLKRLRDENCRGTTPFQLEPFQLFLRRTMSPDSPTRNMLVVHGTGSGKTCTAIQIAESYILRPEFQDKKVLVVASGVVQDNFKTQIFDVTRVKEDNGVLISQQCTGRRYLDMLKRAQQENLRWENPENRDRLENIVKKMIDDFYDFSGYIQFANMVDKMKITLSVDDFNEWIHKTFDGRLMIVDEAHNLREGLAENKQVADALTRVVQVANGMTLVLLTATPMYDSFQEIMFFFNLFLWNDKKQVPTDKLISSEFFDAEGNFRSPEKETTFRAWCHEYISFIRGENPFTFPFRLPPPESMVVPPKKQNYKGTRISKPRKYLPLVGSIVEGVQKERVSEVSGRIQEDMIPTIVVSPDGRPIMQCFSKSGNPTKFQYKYAAGVEGFLSPSKIRLHAAKFATVIRCIQESTGIVFVYSNYVRGGVLQFAMALEEHGFEPALGPKLLENPSGEYSGSGKYAFLTSELTSRQVDTLIRRLRRNENANGNDIRVIIGSPLISEGIDFKFVRQVHILDPWYNMSRLEQIIGRGLRTSSHCALDFQDQNCTIYLHVCRYADDPRECYDETVYRTFVEEKASRIAKVKRVLMESSIDCTSQLNVNQLPESWRNLVIPQRRAQDRQLVEMSLANLSSPTFEDGRVALVCSTFSEAPSLDTTRPLSSYLDVRDQIFNKIQDMFKNKSIWKQEDLLEKLKYAPDVVKYILESAVNENLELKSSTGRKGTLENKDGLYAFKPLENATMYERSVKLSSDNMVNIDIPEEKKEEEQQPEERAPVVDLSVIRSTYKFPFNVSDFPVEILDWFLVDQVLKPEDKIKHLLSLRTPLPPYADGLIIPGFGYMVVGDGKIYDTDGNLIEPIGPQLDAYKLWIQTHIERISREVKENNRIICTLEDQTLKFAAFEIGEDGHIQRIKRTKTIKPKECSFFKVDELKAFVREFGKTYPKEAAKKENQCMYLSLLARMSSPKTLWVLPEIWSVISNPTNSTFLRSKIA
jgi:Helicase conserved C-terminal domain/Type III restriction enzyme, res subunit